MLNKPFEINKGMDYIFYIYSAQGEKLAKKMKDNSYQYYAGNMVYKNDRSLNYLLMDEGMVNKVSGGYAYEYHLKDHLGNVRVAFQPNGSSTTVTQATEYYPFGMNYTPHSPAGSNRYLYNGKEKQDDVLSTTALDWYDYGARMYDPELARWHSVDPMAEVSRRWSPYTYAYNNPIRFIDPDGMLVDDYFNKQGQYFGSDNAKTDNVKIIDSKDWDSNKQVSDNGTETIDHDKGNALSTNFSEAGMTTEATLDVYDHYNPTDLDLAAKQDETGAGGLTFHAEQLKNGNTSERIDVKIEGNKSNNVADHANKIINAFVHEEKHYNDYKDLGFNGYRNIPLDRREQRAVSTQMNHESYERTSPGYQKAVIIYGQSHGMLFPLKPIPAIVTPNSR